MGSVIACFRLYTCVVYEKCHSLTNIGPKTKDKRPKTELKDRARQPSNPFGLSTPLFSLGSKPVKGRTPPTHREGQESHGQMHRIRLFRVKVRARVRVEVRFGVGFGVTVRVGDGAGVGVRVRVG